MMTLGRDQLHITVTYTHTHTLTHTHTHTQTSVQIPEKTHTYTQTLTHSLTHTNTHTHTDERTDTRKHTNTHKRTDTRKHTHTHTVTHTSIQTPETHRPRLSHTHRPRLSHTHRPRLSQTHTPHTHVIQQHERLWFGPVMSYTWTTTRRDEVLESINQPTLLNTSTPSGPLCFWPHWPPATKPAWPWWNPSNVRQAFKDNPSNHVPQHWCDRVILDPFIFIIIKLISLSLFHEFHCSKLCKTCFLTLIKND